MNKLLRKIATKGAPLLGAGAIGVCPLCWAGSAAFLTYVGLGALIPVWQAIVFVILAIGLIGFAFDYRSHKNPWPLILYVIGGITLYLGRYVFGGADFTGWPIWGTGAALIVAAVVYNKKQFSKPSSYTCKECGFIYESKEWAQKCEDWCKEKQSCNLDIIKHGHAPKENN